MNNTNNLLTATPKSAMTKVIRLMEVEAQIKALTEEKDMLKTDLLKVTRDLDVLSLKTGSYTISRVSRITQKVSAFKDLRSYLDEKDIPYMVEEAFAENMKETFKQMAKQAVEKKETIPGLDITESEYIAVRLK